MLCKRVKNVNDGVAAVDCRRFPVKRFYSRRLTTRLTAFDRINEIRRVSNEVCAPANKFKFEVVKISTSVSRSRTERFAQNVADKLGTVAVQKTSSGRRQPFEIK